MKRWEEMLGDIEAPFEFSLGMQPGARFQARPPYPDLEVRACTESYVRRLVMQRLQVAAFTPEDDGTQLLEVVRLVAELEGGVEVEVFGQAGPLQPAEKPVDLTRCAACGRTIPHGQAVEHEGAAYHRGTCIVEDSAPRGHVPRREVKEAP